MLRLHPERIELRERAVRELARESPRSEEGRRGDRCILTAAVHMLKTGAEYQDLGRHHPDRIDRVRATDRLLHLVALGCNIHPEPSA